MNLLNWVTNPGNSDRRTAEVGLLLVSVTVHRMMSGTRYEITYKMSVNGLREFVAETGFEPDDNTVLTVLAAAINAGV